jgi:MFS family permease
MVNKFGGVNTGGIRPLFFAGLIITVGTFSLVFTQLSSQKWTLPNKGGESLFKGISQVFKSGKNLKRWLFISAISQLPISMVFPFSQVFASQIKVASAWILGAMVTGAALTSIVFAIPLGRLADKVGRRKVLFLTIPLFLLSNVMLILAPSPVFLVLAGILQGFYYIGSPITAAIERELVPSEYMGRWVGITRFFKMTIGAILALTAGIIWDKIGPQYIFITFIGIELLVRLPLLISMPETLNRQIKKELPL